MSCVGFEPTILASEREKTVHALERSATVTCSEEHIAPIFRVKELANQETLMKKAALLVLHASCFMRFSCLAYFFTLKMEAICSSETSVNFHRPTQRCTPKDRALAIAPSVHPVLGDRTTHRTLTRKDTSAKWGWPSPTWERNLRKDKSYVAVSL
jgi:hypothetical protein